MGKTYSLKEAKEYQRITQSNRATQEFYDASYTVSLIVSLCVGLIISGVSLFRTFAGN